MYKKKELAIKEEHKIQNEKKNSHTDAHSTQLKSEEEKEEKNWCTKNQQQQQQQACTQNDAWRWQRELSVEKPQRMASVKEEGCDDDDDGNDQKKNVNWKYVQLLSLFLVQENFWNLFFVVVAAAVVVIMIFSYMKKLHKNGYSFVYVNSKVNYYAFFFSETDESKLLSHEL